MMSFFRSLLSFVLLTSLFLVLLPLIGFWLSDVHWFFDLCAQFMLPAVIAACGLSIVAGLFKRSGTGALALAIAITTSLSTGTWTTGHQGVPENAPRFKVLHFNVWHRNGELTRVADVIRRADADMVVLLEVTPRIRDQLKPVADTYPYRLGCADGDPCNILILSRARLSANALVRTSDSFRSPLLSFNTSLGGCPMTVYAAHLTRPYPFTSPNDQMRQAREVANEVAAFPNAKLVVGDFNAAPWGYVTQSIATRAGLSVLSGPGGTWPVSLPKQMRIPIDHMLAGPGLAFVRRDVLPAAGSDHAPVLATVAIVDPARCKGA
jgi:endonuclease/exonuclease/phosphatase (EEP) superfamily protein YafD